MGVWVTPNEAGMNASRVVQWQFPVHHLSRDD
jgi:hypothetical protein